MDTGRTIGENLSIQEIEEVKRVDCVGNRVTPDELEADVQLGHWIATLFDPNKLKKM